MFFRRVLQKIFDVQLVSAEFFEATYIHLFIWQPSK